MPLTARQRSIHNKNGAKRPASFTKGKRPRKSSEGEYLATNAPTDLASIAYPGGAVALLLLLTVRLLSAYYGQVADCDETYNYWEPLHYLVYGSGLQTWEYSPVYAIRSYLPLWLFSLPAQLLQKDVAPATIFYLLRGILAVLTAIAELMFYKAVCHEFGVHIGRLWLCLALPAAGTFAAAPALLPSAWGHGLASAALACWWRRRYAAAIMLTAANAILCWPFTALIGLPIAIDMLIMKRRIGEFAKWSLLSLLYILVPAVVVDSFYYGRLVVAPWNIVKYNVLTEHGPDLYGVEPWTYYLVNGFLNFNVVWVLALACPLLLASCAALTAGAAPRAGFCSPYWLSLQPLYAWLAVFVLQPHKEERFLYPVYSMIVLAGAISLDCLQKMTFAAGAGLLRWRQRHYLAYTAPLMYVCVILAHALGISRSVALYNNYHGTMTILSHLPERTLSETISAEGEPHWLCFGKEWYRSPSSFLLPNAYDYQMRFIKSDFDGQMPAPYDTAYNATNLIQPHFNDQNREDNRTYLPPARCHYLVDSDLGRPTALQPHYHRDASQWEVAASVPILDAERSHPVYRAFYVPVLSAQNTQFGSLYLLRNKGLFRRSD